MQSSDAAPDGAYPGQKRLSRFKNQHTRSKPQYIEDVARSARCLSQSTAFDASDTPPQPPVADARPSMPQPPTLHPPTLQNPALQNTALQNAALQNSPPVNHVTSQPPMPCSLTAQGSTPKAQVANAPPAMPAPHLTPEPGDVSVAQMSNEGSDMIPLDVVMQAMARRLAS